jgi:hypothetical protein
MELSARDHEIIITAYALSSACATNGDPPCTCDYDCPCPDVEAQGGEDGLCPRLSGDEDNWGECWEAYFRNDAEATLARL